MRRWRWAVKKRAFQGMLPEVIVVKTLQLALEGRNIANMLDQRLRPPILENHVHTRLFLRQRPKGDRRRVRFVPNDVEEVPEQHVGGHVGHQQQHLREARQQMRADDLPRETSLSERDDNPRNIPLLFLFGRDVTLHSRHEGGQYRAIGLQVHVQTSERRGDNDQNRDVDVLVPHRGARVECAWGPEHPEAPRVDVRPEALSHSTQQLGLTCGAALSAASSSEQSHHGDRPGAGLEDLVRGVNKPLPRTRGVHDDAHGEPRPVGGTRGRRMASDPHLVHWQAPDAVRQGVPRDRRGRRPKNSVAGARSVRRSLGRSVVALTAHERGKERPWLK
mmetsp:Transcript_115094/g.325220  ORF Transcript_115094/g.325220 Transcript_115094/m.325220 type:complete len:333 (+) Transcript_115094:876-1874(+)